MGPCAAIRGSTGWLGPLSRIRTAASSSIRCTASAAPTSGFSRSTIGELWAIAITLRVVLIENLTRLAAGIVSRLALRERADALADEWLSDAAAQMAPSTAARAAEAQRLGNAFGAQLYQRLRDHDPETTPGLAWLHRTFAAQGTAADDIVHSEHQRQGAVNLSVRNVITSLRLISAVDWAKFFESVSLVDELMRERSSFAAFDFSTRDLYRHAIEEIARRSPCTEMDVARRALDLAQRAESRAARTHAHRSRSARPNPATTW